MTSDGQTTSLINSSKRERATVEEILVLIGEVENSKQIHLSDAERGALAVDLYNLGESKRQIERRANAIRRNKDYGRISLDLWMESSTVYTASEVSSLVEERIKQRRDWFKNMEHYDDDQLMKEGLAEIQSTWYREAVRIIESHKARLTKKFMAIKKSYYLLPQEAKVELLHIAFSKGLFQNGNDYERNSLLAALPQLIPMMPEEFERLIKNHSVKSNGHKAKT